MATATPNPLPIVHWRCCLCHTPNTLTRDPTLPASIHPFHPARCALCHNAPCARCPLSPPHPDPAEWRARPADHRGFLCQYCGAATVVAPRRWWLDGVARRRFGDPAAPAAGGLGNGVAAFERGRRGGVVDLLLARCARPACGREISDECVVFYVPRTPAGDEGRGWAVAVAGWVREAVRSGVEYDWGLFWRDRNMGWVAGAVFFGVCFAGSAGKAGGGEGYVA